MTVKITYVFVIIQLFTNALCPDEKNEILVNEIWRLF